MRLFKYRVGGAGGQFLTNGAAVFLTDFDSAALSTLAFGCASHQMGVMTLGRYFGLFVTAFTTILAFSSWVDGVVTLWDFFGDFVELYRSYIRGPLEWAFAIVWPDSWPAIPIVFFDLLTIWIASIGAYKCLEKTDIFEPRPAPHLIYPYLLGPFVLINAALSVRETKKIRDENLRMWDEYASKHANKGESSERESYERPAELAGMYYVAAVEQAQTLCKYYFFIVASMSLLLFAAWYIGNQCESPTASMKRVGVCEWRLAPN